MTISKKHLLVAAVATVLCGGFASDVCASAVAPDSTESTREDKIRRTCSADGFRFIREQLNNESLSLDPKLENRIVLYTHEARRRRDVGPDLRDFFGKMCDLGAPQNLAFIGMFKKMLNTEHYYKGIGGVTFNAKTREISVTGDCAQDEAFLGLLAMCIMASNQRCSVASGYEYMWRVFSVGVSDELSEEEKSHTYLRAYGGIRFGSDVELTGSACKLIRHGNLVSLHICAPKEVSAENRRELIEATKGTKQLKELAFTGHGVDMKLQEWIPLIVENPSLTYLNLSHSGFGSPEDFEALNTIFKTAHGLKCINLENNWITDEGAKAIAEGLRVNNGVEIVDLDHNRIGDEGARAIAEGLKSNKSLRDLYLGVLIGKAGRDALHDAIKMNTTVKLHIRKKKGLSELISVRERDYFHWD